MLAVNSCYCFFWDIGVQNSVIWRVKFVYKFFFENPKSQVPIDLHRSVFMPKTDKKKVEKCICFEMGHEAMKED